MSAPRRPPDTGSEAGAAMSAAASGRILFRASAAGALALHAGLLLASDGVRGGGDLLPHLRLVQRMAEDPGLHNVYAPAYHALGALLVPLTGLAAYPEWFAWISMAALIGAFRIFQRAASLPDESAAVFAWAPYHFGLTLCLPKIEAAGYALALLGLAALLRRRHVAVAVCLLAAFWVHTAAALFLGLTGGVLALVQRDARGFGALAVGTALALPLPLAHVAAGCSVAEAFLFSQGDYLRAAPRTAPLAQADRLLLLANPAALVAAALGARALWRRHRAVAWLCALIVVLYLNELWLMPFDARTTLDLLRGLTVLAIPLAAASGLAVAHVPTAAVTLVVASAAVAAFCAFAVLPDTCVSKPLDVTRVERFEVDRCTFRWRPASGARPPGAPPVRGARPAG